MKRACPTAYAFPFDDPSSTYQCRNKDPGNSNTMGYTITFCPGNTLLTQNVGVTNSAVTGTPLELTLAAMLFHVLLLL